jgi:nitroimidazol reductase NimA-like FMN-containing flavoprotein (pyridoxamine 5'-phosphate oxidase superfamily)
MNTMNTMQPWLEELSLPECRRLLAEHEVGRVGFILDSAPMVIPVNYRFVETSERTWIAVRTRPETMLDRADVLVAFEIDETDPVRHEGWSVVVRGTLHHIYPDVAAFRERFDPEPWVSEDRDAWLVIEPFAITGRRLHAASSGWAFHARAYL